MDGDQPHDHAGDLPAEVTSQVPRRRRRAPWRLPTARRLARGVAIGLAVLVPAAAWGVTTAQTQASLGPHLAHYEVTVDHLVTIDLGPLGTVVIDSPLPLTLGVAVVVQEIPREVTAVDEASTLEALGADLQGYVQFFGSPEATLGTAVSGLAADAARRSLLAALALVLGAVAVRALLGPRRRAEVAAALVPYRLLAGSVALGLVMAGTLTSSGPAVPSGDDAQAASAVFDGTPLEGARLTGRLAGVIDTYGGYVVDAYRTNETFYDGAVAALDVAWAGRAALDEAMAALRAEHDPPDVPDGGVDDPGTDEPVVLLVVSDLHCNVGMARVIRRVAELAAVDVVLNAGDSTVNGTAVEQYCVAAFAAAAPHGVTTVISDGNHDSVETSAQEAEAGAVVLDGGVVEVDGLRILGDADPNATRIGAGTRLAGEEGLAQAGTRLADVACADGDVDLLLVHTPAVGTEAMERGCVPVQVSGHLHRRYGPGRVGDGVRYVSASTAGATLDQPTVGPLQGFAELTILRVDPATSRVTDHRLVRVGPDGAVTVGLAVAWPTGASVPSGTAPSSAPR